MFSSFAFQEDFHPVQHWEEQLPGGVWLGVEHCTTPILPAKREKSGNSLFCCCCFSWTLAEQSHNYVDNSELSWGGFAHHCKQLTPVRSPFWLHFLNQGNFSWWEAKRRSICSSELLAGQKTNSCCADVSFANLFLIHSTSIVEIKIYPNVEWSKYFSSDLWLVGEASLPHPCNKLN